MTREKRSVIYFSFSTFLIVIICIFAANKTITVLSEGLPLNHRNCIIIDAGHGGVDGGATSCTGKLESAFNLEIALRLDDLFHFLGYETKMIRTSDISVYTKGETIAQKKASDLKERVQLCNKTDKAVLLSIHQNYFADGRYSGAQVFYADDEDSRTLAQKLQPELIRTLNTGSHRNIKKADGVYLMEHIRCTGVLIECGFLSNPEEEAKLRSVEYQKQLCCVLATAVANFLDG